MTATLEARLRTQLARDEGRSRLPYRDSAGHLTIGIGHLLSKGVSDAVIDQLFSDDLCEITGIRARLPWMDQLSEARQGVLYNMTFNLGVAGVLEFRQMLAALEAGDYETAARELLDSTYAVQVGARAERLAAQLRLDEWQ